VSEFMRIITSDANMWCKAECRTIVNVGYLIWAMDMLRFSTMQNLFYFAYQHIHIPDPCSIFNIKNHLILCLRCLVAMMLMNSYTQLHWFLSIIGDNTLHDIAICMGRVRTPDTPPIHLIIRWSLATRLLTWPNNKTKIMCIISAWV
jgi:hypothetical protein